MTCETGMALSFTCAFEFSCSSCSDSLSFGLASELEAQRLKERLQRANKVLLVVFVRDIGTNIKSIAPSCNLVEANIFCVIAFYDCGS